MSSTDSQLKLRYGATDIIFVSLDKRQEKIFDTVWAHYLRSNEKEKIIDIWPVAVIVIKLWLEERHIYAHI